MKFQSKEIDIFLNIWRDEHTINEKVQAIYYVIGLPTHEFIPKSKMLHALGWLASLYDKTKEAQKWLT